MMEQLAVRGGAPVWREGWPAWPQPGAAADRLAAVARGDRWAVSGNWTGCQTVDAELGEAFAAFVGARYCLPVDHGSSALLAGLHALGVAPGDEVIVPGLTWVACASVVARAGAVPVLVDIDPRTMCMDPDAVEAAITPATAAILVVHLYSAMADMDALGAIAARHGLPIIEDAAQAYGAAWRGAGAGSLGAIGAFSAQQGKVLTSGEGGLFVTSDPVLRDRVEMLRGDGRRYPSETPPLGAPGLVEHSVVQGWNMHLSEFQAALLLEGLQHLPEQNLRRGAAAAVLDKSLAGDDLDPIEPHPANDVRSFYHYAIRLRGALARHPVDVVCQALSAELGYWIHPPYPPLNAHPLFDPRRLPGGTGGPDPRRFDLPVAHHEVGRTVLLHHPMLLGDEDHLAAIVAAFDKVRRLAARLPA